MRQIDLLKFKIKRTKHSDAKRVKVPIEENEIKAVDYLQKQMEFYKRTIKFVDSIKQKDLDKSTVEQLKTQLATQISAIRSTDPTDRKIREDNLTAETDEKIIRLTKVEVDGKWINKPYYKDQIDFVPITSTKETLESINLKDDLSSTSTNNELRTYVAKAKKVMFACEAGMGSSAMGAGMIKKMINNLGVKDVEVANCAIKDLPNDIDIIVTQKTFVDYVSKKYKNSYVYGVNQYLKKKDEYKELIDTFKQERLA
ncbi:PTS mannose transporter [Mycoplasmoides gallisepticum]|nr:PTS mannose transporter [Mycoplasmoides gallisepticum]